MKSIILKRELIHKNGAGGETLLAITECILIRGVRGVEAWLGEGACHTVVAGGALLKQSEQTR